MSGASEHDPIREQAEYWLVRRRDTDERFRSGEEFQRWLAADPRHRAAYEAAETLWNELEGLRFSQRLRAEAGSESKAGLARSRNATLAFAACLALIAAAVGFHAMRPASVPLVETYATEVGRQHDVDLVDGSRMLLNSATRVQTQYGDHLRMVILHEGEAFFDVARDAGKPFVVSVGDGRVTALGTRFQVLREESEVRVTLSEGSVRIENGTGAARVLVPGEQALFDPVAGDIQVSHVDLDATASWTRKRLDFRDVRLAEAIDQANRYSLRKIRLSDPALGDLRVSGNFRIGDNEGIADAFAAALTLHAGPEPDGGILLSARR